MKEDIKILEEIKYQKIIRNKQIEDDIYDNEVLMAQYEERISEIQAIENLINRNKEIESDLYSANCIISEQIDIIRDSIPKSKVIEKIEERKSWLCSNDIAYKDDYVLEVLQELLEE